MLIELFDFSDPRAVDAWRTIDDRVMGGISRSTLRHDSAGHAVFEGTVSLAQTAASHRYGQAPASSDRLAPPPA